MKARIFTLLSALFLMGTLSSTAQLDIGTGVTWGTLSPSEPLLLNENFQGYDFYHNDLNTDMGNSDHIYDTDGTTIIYGFKNQTNEVPIIGSDKGKIKYTFYQCAFAPDWKAAWAFRDNGENTPNVSDGFVEISRKDSVYSTIPTVHGTLTVDLREIEFVEVIQWSHSSTGGNKRGVMCEISINDGTTWDTLRYQPGNNWGFSFTKDPTTGVKTSNGYRCDPSAYGMTWEDGIYTSNVMLRFGEAGGQTPRIHDLKVYGTYTPPTAIKEIKDSNIKISNYNRNVRISEPAKVAIYSITGNLVKMVENEQLISLETVPAGIYLVKASNGKQMNVKKIIIQ
jgi:hypothetical protein